MKEKNWLDELLFPALSTEKVKKIKVNYEILKSQPLSSIGIDSLDMMNIILAIEDISGEMIDFSRTKPSDLDSLEKIEVYIWGK